MKNLARCNALFIAIILLTVFSCKKESATSSGSGTTTTTTTTTTAAAFDVGTITDTYADIAAFTYYPK